MSIKYALVLIENETNKEDVNNLTETNDNGPKGKQEKRAYWLKQFPFLTPFDSHFD